MGCTACKGGKGATKQTPDTQEEHEVSNPPTVTTTLPTPSSPSAGATPVATVSPTAVKDGKSASAQNADDDDEIEIIYETAPKKLAQAKEEPQLTQIESPANGQEPPDAIEPESRPKKAFEAFGAEPIKPVEQQPLSKAQQEEAAKLAERRSKFDNQRYQRDSAVAVPDKSTDMMLKDLVEDLERAAPTPKSQHAPPTTDMMMGLNHNHNRYSLQDDCAGLPGGIMDDMDTINVAHKAPPKKKNNHGFDADDEQLMADILHDLADIEDL